MLTKDMLHGLSPVMVEIGISWGGEEDTFEDVTIVVSNADTEQEAVDRAWAFIEAVVEEYQISQQEAEATASPT